MSDGTTHGSVLEQMDTFLELVREGELGKEAAANLDLAGDAKSTHPSANVDDGTKPATEGSRSSENEADVKKTTPGSINNDDAKNQEGGSTNFADTQGTESMASDSGLKGNVDTPKKDHSKAMSDAGPGDDTFDNNWDKASAAEQASLLLKEGNGILEAVAGLSKKAGEDGEEAPAAAPAGGEPAQAPEAAPTETPPAEGQPAEGQPADGGGDKEAQARADLYKEAAEKHPEDMEAGYVAASLLAQQLGLGETKEAADAVKEQVAEAVAGLRKQAEADADLFCSFLKGYGEKQAGLEELLAGAGGGAGAPGAEGGAPAALADEGEAGGEMGVGGAPGAPGAEAALGADGEGAEPSDEESVEAIAELLDEAGVTAEDLAAALAEAQGGGGELGGLGGGEGAPGELGAPGAAPGGEEIPPEALAALGGGAGGGLEAAAAGTPATTKQGSGSKRGALKKLAKKFLAEGK